MPLKGRFSLYLYDLGANLVNVYDRYAESVRWTHLAPGGYGQFEARLKLANADLLHDELAIFSRIAVMDTTAPEGHMCRFLGEITDPELGLSETDGEFLHIVGEGLGATLRDDPDTHSYTNQTAQQILNAEMTFATAQGTRTNYQVIDLDTGAILPDNPATLFSPSYSNNTQEEVIQDVCTKLGDYNWGVTAHMTHRDGFGFPTGQLQVHVRDRATVNYQAFDADIAGLRLKPAVSRSINVVELGYNDPTQTPPIGRIVYKDPRLATNGSQGTAPFRRRKYVRDLGGITTATKAQVQAIANSMGALWQNIGFTTEVQLRNVRDGNGNPIPLWQVQADANILLPNLSRRAAAFVKSAQLPTSATKGVNLFYIRSAEYSEGVGAIRGGAQTLTLQLDNFYDDADSVIARLQLQADQVARLGVSTTGPTQGPGAPAQGVAGGPQQASGAGQIVGFTPTFQAALQQVPTSVTLGTPQENVNVSGGTVGVSNLSALGFTLFWSSAGAGKTSYVVPYVTVGNTLFDVDTAAGTFAHHCMVCESRYRAEHGCLEGCPICYARACRHGLDLLRDAVFHPHPETQHKPGTTGLSVYCPCGASEHFNTALTAMDEVPNGLGTWRAEMAGRIRTVLAHHAKHGQQGAALIEDWHAAQQFK